MTQTSITLTAFACAIVFLTALQHWLSAEHRWLRIYCRRQDQLVAARAALLRQGSSQASSATEIAASVPTTAVDDCQSDENWEDWLDFADPSARNNHSLPVLAYYR